MRIPDHARPAVGDTARLHRLKALLRKSGLHTVCESARCPNIGECFGRGTATFLILGDACTRSCAFCAVRNGNPSPVDPGEPQKVADTAKTLGLKYVVVTSVTRDDLPDGGAAHFAQTIKTIRGEILGVRIEVLIPDFTGDAESLRIVINVRPNVLNHNIETVPRLYPAVRPQADYARSIELISRVKQFDIAAKSGLMLGMGEESSEVITVMKDLRRNGCDILTLGQYLRPTRRHLPVTRYLDLQEFDTYRAEGEKLGFRAIAAGPLVRSSYRADEMELVIRS